eukprot:TRINITY_DN1248_c0_g1_i1.p1 TRINITY_DN1248_c0_g1~~TRINITY_DN1248_c0_g1_i1.p1  ORF type:complete len:191 (+),score=29.07 TRINITY_DN1248_c0_g1_i1:71-643(+)
MDPLNKMKTNWYFWRQRNKEKKRVLKQARDLALSQFQECNFYRTRFNSFSRSLSQSLSQIQQLHNTIYFLKTQVTIKSQHIHTLQNISVNLKSQVQILKSPKLLKRINSKLRRPRDDKENSTDDELYVPPDEGDEYLDSQLCWKVKHKTPDCVFKRLFGPSQSKIPHEVLQVKNMMSNPSQTIVLDFAYS